MPSMAEYEPSMACPHCPANYRILDCWECFEAKGKVCMDASHGSMFHFIQTSKTGVVFCCKQDYNEGFCEDGARVGTTQDDHYMDMVCSPPSHSENPTESGKYADVFTGKRNH